MYILTGMCVNGEGIGVWRGSWGKKEGGGRVHMNLCALEINAACESDHNV